MQHVDAVTILIPLCVTLAATLPRPAQAQCEADEGVKVLGQARNARGIVGDLELMRAWHGDIARDVDETNARLGAILDPEEMGIRHSASWLWWSDSFDGFRLCTDNMVDLDRSWWGAQARFTDLRNGLGYELFYLAATDALGLRGDLDDYEYGFRHRIAGAQLQYRDWVSVRAGTIDIEAPSRSGDGLHEGSAYLAVGLPRFGIGADLLVHPGSRRVDTLMLGVRRARLPWAGLTVSADGGWLEDERKGLFGVGVTAAEDALRLQLVAEGAPVRLRSVTMRVESAHRYLWTEDFWFKAGFAPFLEVSAYNGAAFEAETGRALVPGAVTGARGWLSMGVLSTGVEAFVGVNHAHELSRLGAVVDHLHWGGRFYVRLGI